MWLSAHGFQHVGICRGCLAGPAVLGGCDACSRSGVGRGACTETAGSAVTRRLRLGEEGLPGGGDC